MIFYPIICGLILCGILCYIYVKITCGYTDSKSCLVGKTAIVTGGNSGIGFEVALGLASRGCRVIIADKDNTEMSTHLIIEETHNRNVIGKFLDLGSLKSVRKFVKEIYESETRLDILINNAGVGIIDKELSEDGLDYVMQVNHFGPFLLTYLLVDLLKKSAPSRIIFTSSCMAFASSMKLKHLNNPGWAPFRYTNSKLCALLTADEFARRLRDTGVTSNSLHPGLVYSNLFYRSYENHAIPFYLLFIFNFIFSKTTKEGAQTTIHLAIANELENVTGKYFWDCKPFWKPKIATDKQFGKDVFESSVDFVKLDTNERRL